MVSKYWFGIQSHNPADRREERLAGRGTPAPIRGRTRKKALVAACGAADTASNLPCGQRQVE